MKIISSLIFICLISIKTIAKNADSASIFSAGKIILSAGFGLHNLDKALNENEGNSLNNNYSSFKSTGWYGPIHFRAEYGLSDKIGIGISLNYDSYGGIRNEIYMINPNGTQLYYFYKKNVNELTGLIRFNYHVMGTKKLDPYFAFGGGFRSFKTKYTTDNPYSNPSGPFNDLGAEPFPVAVEAVAGLRYYFTPHIGIYSEIGMAKSIIQIGMSVGF
ncbi:MAG: hypothetical protein HY840_08920 [Bacteroidetes bacterium]|nr:hypothetical protein [Bacteroidota bacterium]